VAIEKGYAIKEIRNEPELVALRRDPRYNKLEVARRERSESLNKALSGEPATRLQRNHNLRDIAVWNSHGHSVALAGWES